MNNSFSLLVPAYKEEEFIESSLRGLLTAFINKKYNFEVIVVIDRVPNDKTFEIVKKLSEEFDEIKIIARDGKRGIAHAIRDGIKEATKDVTILVMGENSQDPDDIVLMASKMNKGFDMVFGNRLLTKEKFDQYPFTKYLANRLCNYAIRILFGMKSGDITNGIKAYKTEILKKIEITSTGFEVFAEIPIQAFCHGYKNFTEIPLKYFGREPSFSKFNLTKEAPRYFKIVMKYYFKR